MEARSLKAHLISRARALKAELVALGIAARDPATPWLARVLVLAVAAYALSPIDLIPDFIPVLGYVDDLLIVPLGIAMAIRLIPPHIMARARQQAQSMPGPSVSYGAALFVGLVWIIALGLTGLWLHGLVR